MEITEQDLIDALDSLPEDKKNCLDLGVNALRNAVQNYLEKQRL